MFYYVLQSNTIPYHSVDVPQSHTYSFHFFQLCTEIRYCHSDLYCVVLYQLLSLYTLLVYIYIYTIIKMSSRLVSVSNLYNITSYQL